MTTQPPQNPQQPKDNLDHLDAEMDQAFTEMELSIEEAPEPKISLKTIAAIFIIFALVPALAIFILTG